MLISSKIENLISLVEQEVEADSLRRGDFGLWGIRDSKITGEKKRLAARKFVW